MTRIRIGAGSQRARVDLVGGAVVPRLIERGPSSARVALVAGGALLLGGDAVSIEVVVADGCSLELEDIGGTVAYDADGVASSWSVDISVGVGARLSWLGQPLIVAGGANVERSTRIRLAHGAVVVLREVVVLGRSGEAGGRAVVQTSVTDAGGPVLEESVELDGGAPVPGVLGANRVFDSLALLGAAAPCGAPDGAVLLTLEQPGAVARFLGDEAHRSPLAELWLRWATDAGRQSDSEPPSPVSLPSQRNARITPAGKDLRSAPQQ
ncbi:urease accessory protein UreD [Pseudoclavibacter helvolus]|uniref:urease accessory protein UreD n=1 Tax=Pseudoclavibacter helvolus TaxID=255205 RepID=UPI0024AD201A|nr:urease accessory protein UreD [Pseudoclavibacter helvolus]